MPSVKGVEIIILQPNDADISYKFRAAVCSAEDANDGAIPYNTNVSSVSVTAYDEDGNVVTDLVQGSPSVSDNVVTITLSYPSTSGTGRYKLTCVMTLNTGTTIEWDYDRVYAEDN